MIGVGIPATTTSRGIGRVATLAEALPGSTITNGPAFLDAGTFKVTPTPTANAVPQADASGTLDAWVSLAGKANLNMDNLTQVGTTAIAHNAMPSTRIIDVPGSVWLLAPADGWAFADSGAAQGAMVCVDVSANASGSPALYGAGSVCNYPLVTLPVKKGMYYRIRAISAAKFIYAEGAY